VSRQQADRYVREAVLQSSEGVILMPAVRSENEYDRVRLGEIAQALRQPLALCFLERAIRTMEKGTVDGEESYVGVPEGQGKFRARIGADGSVVRVEALESGFTDREMEACAMKVMSTRVFPVVRSQSQTYIDIVYWVSLGFHATASSPELAEHLRREQVKAAIRARPCLTGTVSPGVYEVEGLSLFANDGRTLVNRVDHGDLPAEASRCVAQAFRQIVLSPEPDAFVRPASPRTTFTVREDGTIAVADEDWLRLVELEEQALREERRRALSGSGVDAGEPTQPAPAPVPGPAAPEPGPAPPEPAPASPRQDPGQRGLKLELRPRT
jgi:hypothetical protein